MYEYDVMIIGAGPIGMFASYIGSRMGLKIAILDKASVVGGQCIAIYPDKTIDDIPGMNLLARDLVKNLEIQMNLFPVDKYLEIKSLSISNDKNNFTVECNSIVCSTKKIIFATGFGIPIPNKPKLDNIEELELRGFVQYYMENLEKFKDKNVIVGGGGDSALDWCLELSRFAKKIYWIHRRNNLHCMEGSLNLIKQNPLLCNIMLNRQIDKIDIIKDKINLHTANENIIADYFIPCYGIQINNSFLLEFDFKLTAKHKIIVNDVYESSIKGIYAIGDANYYHNKNNLIVVGFAEAANCLHDIYFNLKNKKYISY